MVNFKPTQEQEGFNANQFPSSGGFGVRQSRIVNNREAYLVRNMVKWFIPETGVVEMYINPSSIRYADTKDISEQRTKNGYLLQYFGEKLGQVTINGTTGTSGIEGINVLYDIYRNEQIALDPLALTNQAGRQNVDFSFTDFVKSESEAFIGNVNNIIENGYTNPTRPRPTLGSMAFGVEMYWSGWVFRGFFTSFSLTESSDRLGLFTYDINFNVTQKRGLRLNFLPWHKSATNGPSNSSLYGGIPHSFSSINPQDSKIINPSIQDPPKPFDLGKSQI